MPIPLLRGVYGYGLCRSISHVSGLILQVMDHTRYKQNPNVFGQLRSLAILLNKEPAGLQQQLDNPPSLDVDAAKLLLKETQRDVKKLAVPSIYRIYGFLIHAMTSMTIDECLQRLVYCVLMSSS
jgi:hypothetical protein